MNGKELSHALRSGGYVYGTAILSPSTLWPKVVASLGLDMVFIDTEHTPLNRETVSGMCHVYRAYNLAPVVRIPSPDPYQACMVLDGGASGVIAPYVETAEQVRQLVGAVKHKPVKGRKMQDRLSGNRLFEPGLTDYVDKHNEDNVLIINVESVPALEALDDMLSVDGLDAVLIGPHDLTCSLGIPEQYDHPLFRKTVAAIISKARAKQVGAGIHVWGDVGYEEEISWARNGANLIMHASDIYAFSEALSKELRHIKSSLGESLIMKPASGINI